MSGWPESALGDVCKVIAGQSPKSSAYNDNGKGLPFYQGKKDFTDRYLSPPTKWTTSITKRAFRDDILMSVRAPVGPTNIATEEVCIGRGLAAIRASDKVDQGFLWYALMWMQPKIVGNAGAVFPSINKKQIEALTLPLPPLEEQKRIVAVLDQAFAALDRARANAEANLADAEEILSNQLAKRFLIGGPNWLEKRMGDLCSLITDGKHGDCNNQKDSGYYFLSAKDVRNGVLNYDGARQITFADFQETHRRTDLSAGDVLVTNAGTIGRTAIAKEDPKTERTTFQKSVAVLKPKQEIIDSKFLELGLRANLVNLQKLSAGAAQKNLLLRDLRSFLVRMPERIEEQREAAEGFANFEAKIRLLEGEILSETQDVDDLRQSILEKAFAGELT